MSTPETPNLTQRGSHSYGTETFPIDHFSPQHLADRNQLIQEIRSKAHVGEQAPPPSASEGVAANKYPTADEAVKNYSEKYRQ